MLSLPHLVVLFVIALVVFGPQKLPELARMLGKATAEFRKISSDLRFALEDEVRELERATRIRDEEIAAAAKAMEQPTPTDAAVPRELPAAEPAGQTVPEHAPYAESVRSQQAPPEAVSDSHEKPSDDTAV